MAWTDLLSVSQIHWPELEKYVLCSINLQYCVAVICFNFIISNSMICLFIYS